MEENERDKVMQIYEAAVPRELRDRNNCGQGCVQMCMRSTPVQWRDKHNRDTNKVTEETVARRQATTPRQQVICD